MDSNQTALLTSWAKKCLKVVHHLRLFNVSLPQRLVIYAASRASRIQIRQYTYPNGSPQTPSQLSTEVDTYEEACQLFYATVPADPTLFVIQVNDQKQRALLFIPSPKPEPEKLRTYQHSALQGERIRQLRLTTQQFKRIYSYVKESTAYTCCALARYLVQRMSSQELPQTLAILQKLNKQQLIAVFQPFSELLELVHKNEISALTAYITYLVQNRKNYPFLGETMTTETWALKCVAQPGKPFVVAPDSDYLVGYRLPNTSESELQCWTYPSLEPLPLAPTFIPDNLEPNCQGLWMPVGNRPVIYNWHDCTRFFYPEDNALSTLYWEDLRNQQEQARLRAAVSEEQALAFISSSTKNVLPYTTYKLAQELLAKAHTIERAIERLGEDDLSMFNVPSKQLGTVKYHVAQLLRSGYVSDSENKTLRAFLRR